jgi:hypothetical protein
MILFLVSVLLYAAFVYVVTFHPLPIPWARRRHEMSAGSRFAAAVIFWPLAGFVLFFLGLLVSYIGKILMLPLGVAVSVFMQLA